MNDEREREYEVLREDVECRAKGAMINAVMVLALVILVIVTIVRAL